MLIHNYTSARVTHLYGGGRFTRLVFALCSVRDKYSNNYRNRYLRITPAICVFRFNITTYFFFFSENNRKTPSSRIRIGHAQCNLANIFPPLNRAAGMRMTYPYSIPTVGICRYFTQTLWLPVLTLAHGVCTCRYVCTLYIIHRMCKPPISLVLRLSEAF